MPENKKAEIVDTPERRKEVDEVLKCSSPFCHKCGNREASRLKIEGCHIWCYVCKQVSEGCGD